MANRWGNGGNCHFIFWGSKITADGDCSNEIKRHLFLGRKVMTNLDSILKSRDITLPAKVRLISSVQFSRSVAWLFATPWVAARQATLSIIISQSSLKLTSIESVMPSSHLILCHPLLLLPGITLSLRVFSNESTLRMRWSKYWSFSFSIIPSKEHPWLISFRMDWFYLLAVQGTLKNLLQHHSSKELYAGQQRRHRCIEQFFLTQWEREGGWSGRTALKYIII